LVVEEWLAKKSKKPGRNFTDCLIGTLLNSTERASLLHKAIAEIEKKTESKERRAKEIREDYSSLSGRRGSKRRGVGGKSEQRAF